MLLPPKMSRESKQRVFTNPFVPLIAYCRASRKLPSEVAEWTQYMKRKTGASFFILAAYSRHLSVIYYRIIRKTRFYYIALKGCARMSADALHYRVGR